MPIVSNDDKLSGLIKGLEFTAQQKGLGSAKNVIKLILNQYLAYHLPPDF